MTAKTKMVACLLGSILVVTVTQFVSRPICSACMTSHIAFSVCWHYSHSKRMKSISAFRANCYSAQHTRCRLQGAARITSYGNFMHASLPTVLISYKPIYRITKLEIYTFQNGCNYSEKNVDEHSKYFANYHNKPNWSR